MRAGNFFACNMASNLMVECHLIILQEMMIPSVRFFPKLELVSMCLDLFFWIFNLQLSIKLGLELIVNCFILSNSYQENKMLLIILQEENIQQVETQQIYALIKLESLLINVQISKDLCYFIQLEVGLDLDLAHFLLKDCQLIMVKKLK